ncbi:uncharacterized protein LOC62_02G002075 [Vanrija pseudolonga]|uniref:Uncharacterized protein n=1 Tax=Vanrija pseudolonga TaxID=143232 RepID=A0AAF0Y1M6_9TREE|nr:hypothetical protein LOC62_02G002075 [Vanrija pseudolonga]
MTVIPPGAKLAPVDLPPPPPSADPREPEATATRGRNARTPQRHRSPLSSRASSPIRASVVTDLSSSPPLLAPKPRTAATGSTAAAVASGSPVSPAGAKTAGHAFPHHGHPHLSRPGSPASIHSSGSAIFERDIELPAVASLSLNTSGSGTLNHKSSRIFHPHGSSLEQTVPAVLDDAVEALTASEPYGGGLSGLEIEAPAAASSVGMARTSSAQLSPALRARVISLPPSLSAGGKSPSRSPSPDRLGSSPVASSPFSLGQLSVQQLASPSASALAAGSAASGSPPPPLNRASPPVASAPPVAIKHRPEPLRRLSSGPQLPGGWAFQDEDASGATAVLRSEPGSGGQTPVPSAVPSHLTPTKDKRRISFISYNDLLLSVPTTVNTLGEITSGSLSPDHLPGAVSPSIPTRSPVVAASPVSLSAGVGLPAPPTDALSRQALVGGPEWQREGLGRGLEQRLEDLAIHDNGAQA